MNAEMDRYLSVARAHDLARDRAVQLRHEAMVRFWAQLDEALARAAGHAGRSARRLRQSMLRRATRRAGPVTSRAG